MADKYTADQVIGALEATRGIKSAAARRLGCSRPTVDRYIREYRTVARAYQEQRETFVDVAEGALMKKVQDGDTTAIIFALKTVGRSRGYVERLEVMVQQELEDLVGVLEDGLEPSEFRKVLGLIAAADRSP